MNARVPVGTRLRQILLGEARRRIVPCGGSPTSLKLRGVQRDSPDVVGTGPDSYPMCYRGNSIIIPDNIFWNNKELESSPSHIHKFTPVGVNS